MWPLSTLILPSGKTCTWCGIWKPFAGFPRMKYGKYGYAHLCKPCYLNQRKEYAKRNREFAPPEKRCSRCQGVFALEAFTTLSTSADGRHAYCKECRAKEERDRYRRNSDAVRESMRRLRLQVLQVYSSEVPQCACCGELHLEFLCIDHIGGGGNEHRSRVGTRGGQKLYQLLKKQGFPPGYRVLCLNCNHSLGVRGYCPHQSQRRNE